jgi:hypothetical protein
MSHVAIRHAFGGMESDPSLDGLRALLAELDEVADDEHPDVSICDESGWELSAFRDGTLIWGDVESGDDELELSDVPRDEMVRLFELVAIGRTEELRGLPWSTRA